MVSASRFRNRQSAIPNHYTRPVSVEYLLYPEWQGYGMSSAVYDGAASLALALLPNTQLTLIDSPPAEVLHVRDGVLGLDSIAVRFADTLAHLRAVEPDRIVLVGGTCGVEAAPVAYLNERYGGDLAVVWFDAHGDLNTPATSPSGHFHGMVLRTLTGDGPRRYVSALARPLLPSQIFLAGTRDLDPGESAFIQQHNLSVTTSDALSDPAVLVTSIRGSGYHNVYLHLDLDCFRPDEIPDTLMQTAGGPALGHVIAAHRALSREFHVAGLSVVEYVERGGGSLAKLSAGLKLETHGPSPAPRR
jgi:arginase